MTFEDTDPLDPDGTNEYFKKPVNGSSNGCRNGRDSSSLTIGKSPAHVVIAPDPADFERVTALAKKYDPDADLDSVREQLSCQMPWDIFRVSHTHAPSRFDVWIFDRAAYWPCPVCERQLLRVGNTDPHVFKCQTCRRETYVYVKIPQVDCPDHGRQEAEIPWRQDPDRWTYEGIILPEDEPNRR